MEFVKRLKQIKVDKYVTVFVMYFFLLALLTKSDIQSVADASRIATVKSLVEYQTFTIDNSQFDNSPLFTIDKYFYNNHFYSDKPPLPALMGAAVYFLLNKICGIDLSNNLELTYYLVTLSTVGVLSCIGLVYFHKILLEIFDIKEAWANITTFLAGTGTLILPYSLTFNNHSLAAVFLIASLYYLLKIESVEIRNVILCGILVSMAGNVDITCFLFMPFFLVFYTSKSIKLVFVFILSFIPLLGIYLLLNIYLSGSIVPPAMNSALWEYPGSLFNKENLSGLVTQKSFLGTMKYAFTLFLGSRGLFSHTPLLCFSFMGVIAILRQRILPYKIPYLYGLVASLAFMLMYTFRTVGYGGYSYGVRWFVAPMFILCLPLSHLANQVRSSRLLKKFFVVIASMSIAIALVGTYNPYPNDSTGKVSLGGSYISGYTFLVNANSIANNSSVMYKISLGVSGVAIYFMFNRLLKRFKQTQNIPADDNVV
ncbi:hypothetical protein [Microcoleus sp. bin38.metabat.b11b12b14.051]|uniref:hypothetical protein n=1 Tax=Microcoleus sp. bin38.metabat.b11b12b14.051 TaxID=2742709 RepID=UPI0025EB0DCA|nr:hypothetical protein [Microcoleus sp. bin38.metabat.b11b12b14.051]